LLLTIGNGEYPNTNRVISVSSECGSLVSSIDELKNNVYPDLSTNCRNTQWLCERAILAPLNETVRTINHQLIEVVPGDVHSYKSIDTTVDTDQAVQYPTEFLKSLQLTGLPPHNLLLKVRCPIMLLRNLDAPKLCNGTRLIVKRLMPHLIEATIMTGSGKGEDVFIPRIPLIPSNSTVEFKRLQFPVRLCLAMSINKAQGQSMKVAGLDLSTPCFSHGQLYVGCSRVGSSKALYILAPEGKTVNVVYPGAFK